MTTRWLATLLQAYLHQDWAEDYSSAWDGLQAFLDEEGSAAATGLVEDIRLVMAEQPSEDQLRELVIGELGSGYYPPGDGMGFGAWLAEVAKRASVCANS
jgi:hypothetical protein